MDRPVDIERARREAKGLLRAARAGQPEALAQLRTDREPCLADAQLAVARRLGERSWPALVRRVDRLGRELLDAAAAGSERDVDRLLERGAPPNARDPEQSDTALHLAAARGRVDVVDLLVGWRPVDRHARNAAGRTALGACIEGVADPVTIRVLVSVGLEVEPWMVEHVPGELGTWLQAHIGRSRDRTALPQRLGETAVSTGIALLRLIAGSPLAQVRQIGDGFAVLTGQDDNTRNGVVCSRLDPDTADDEIAAVLDRLAERGAPGQWLLGNETEPSDLRVRLERADCTPERAAVHMAARLAELDLSSRPHPSDLEIGQITDTVALTDALEGPDSAQLFASLGVSETAPLRHYAAHLSGRHAGLATLLIDGRNAAVLDLHVAREARRRGIGRALVLHTLRTAASVGCTAVTIAPTPASVPFYEALGLTLERYPPERCYYTPVRDPGLARDSRRSSRTG